jgi:starch synthase
METVKKLRWVPDLIHCHGWMTALAPLYIKKHYKGDPCFKHSKIVYSVYNDDFRVPFKEDFAKKLKIEGITQNDVKVIKDKPDFESLSKLAIDFSDGVIQGSPSIHPGVKEYAQKKKEFFLDYHPEETYIDVFNGFYDRILA